MTYFALSGLLNLFGFIFGLLSVILLYGIIKRTIFDIKNGFSLIFISIIFFVFFEAIEVLYIYNIINFIFPIEVFLFIFIFFMTIGLFKLKILIKNLSDFGQAFIVTSEKNHEDKLISIIKDVKDVCFISLKEPYKKIVETLNFHNIDTSSMHFIDASGENSNAENCVNVKNDPDHVKKILDRVLKEKGPRCVVIDDISELKNIKEFELPIFIQDASSLIKTSESQGFFIGKIEKMGKGTINDISLIVDKTMGDEKDE